MDGNDENTSSVILLMINILLITFLSLGFATQLHLAQKEFKTENYLAACISSFVAGFVLAAWVALLLML